MSFWYWVWCWATLGLLGGGVAACNDHDVGWTRGETLSAIVAGIILGPMFLIATSVLLLGERFEWFEEPVRRYPRRKM